MSGIHDLSLCRRCGKPVAQHWHGENICVIDDDADPNGLHAHLVAAAVARAVAEVTAQRDALDKERDQLRATVVVLNDTVRRLKEICNDMGGDADRAEAALAAAERDLLGAVQSSQRFREVIKEQQASLTRERERTARLTKALARYAEGRGYFWIGDEYHDEVSEIARAALAEVAK